MRKLLLVLAIVFQLGVLAHMVYGRESIVQTGNRIEILTAPIDPHDPFRGEFVRLSYAMNDMVIDQTKIADQSSVEKRDSVLYTVLKPEPGGTYAPDYLTDTKPESGVFIRGRLDVAWSRALTDRRRAMVRYGIEQWFVQEGRGLEIEERQGVRGGLQVPMKMEVAIGNNGSGVLTGYRWGEVGVQLTIGNMELQPEASATTPDSLSVELNEPSLWMTFENVSDTALSLDFCNLSIHARVGTEDNYEAAFPGCAKGSARNRHELQPGEQTKLAIDLSDPRWHVRQLDTGDVGDLRLMNPRRQFRIVYRYDGDFVGESQAVPFWEGVLRSQAFTGLGRID